MAAVLTSPLAFMVKIRAICNIEGGPAHPGRFFSRELLQSCGFPGKLPRETFPESSLGQGIFPMVTILTSICG